MPTRRPHVVAVLPDSAEAVLIARAAALVAIEKDQPLALVVPVAVRGFTVNAVLVAHRQARIGADARAIVGRVTPVLEALGVLAVVHAAPYRDTYSARFTSSSCTAAVRDLVRALHADTVVVGTSSPLRTELGLPVQVLCPATVEPVDAAEQHPSTGEGLVAVDGAR